MFKIHACLIRLLITFTIWECQNLLRRLDITPNPTRIQEDTLDLKKQTNNDYPKNCLYKLSLYSIQVSQTLVLALQIVPTTKKHNFSLCMSPISNALLVFINCNFHWTIHICSVCHVAKHLCTKITQNLDCLLQQDRDHLPISRIIK